MKKPIRVRLADNEHKIDPPKKKKIKALSINWVVISVILESFVRFQSKISNKILKKTKKITAVL